MKNSSILGIVALGAAAAYFLFGKNTVVNGDTGGASNGVTPASKWQTAPEEPVVSAVTTQTANKTETYVNVPTVYGFAPTGTLNAGSMPATQVTRLVSQLQSVASQQARGVDNATIINQALAKSSGGIGNPTGFKSYIPSNVQVRSVAKTDSIAYKLGYIK